MIEYFLEKYKDKTDYDLLSIINNKIDYRHEAVNAAIKIYNERNSTSIPFIGDFNEVKKEENKPSESRSLKFLKSLRLKDFYTLITISIFLCSIYSLISLYGSEDFFIDNREWIEKMFFFLSFIWIHILYKYDHNKSNSFFGRVQLDILFLIILLLVKFLIDFIFDGFQTSYDIDISGDTPIFIFIVFLLLLLLELVIEVMKKILRTLKVEIL
ncbi:hypothetical protein [Marivirga sp.]|uniref:hypothetical protein n=1 Tax=Marivirga sp. TaxID=2018662 RepID=UPI003DA780FE